MAVEYTILWWNFADLAVIRLGTVMRGFLRSPIMNRKPESQNSIWRIQYGSQIHYFWVKIWKFCRNDYSEGFEVANYESKVRITKFKMANPIWRSNTILWWNFEDFAVIRLGTVMRGFLRSPITNVKPESQNSIWRIQYGSQFNYFWVKL